MVDELDGIGLARGFANKCPSEFKYLKYKDDNSSQTFLFKLWHHLCKTYSTITPPSKITKNYNEFVRCCTYYIKESKMEMNSFEYSRRPGILAGTLFVIAVLITLFVIFYRKR